MTATKTASPSTETTLIIKRTFSVPKDRVFEAWTNPDLLKQWFIASNEYTSSPAEVDLRVGGKYRMGMKHKESGNVHTAIGTYREVKPPDRLVFTWAWEGNEADETLVTVDFRESGDGTEMTLRHERFPNKETRDKHEDGWVGCFGHLTNTLTGK